ncbi:hypothetical protein DVH24_013473 [Malus domestica]|uniref:Uncharacterized protein n=1 Tax=Malus domestica TaxID=3750 RepID=A0A498HMU5_MALDO|nr:hypothetical protein DVH24_013473 [Malus domestica]
MASDPCEGTEGKYVWPELLVAEGMVAEATIKRENSTVNIEIVVEGTILPADFRCVADRFEFGSIQMALLPGRFARMSFECEGKDTWPELVGAKGKEAEATIESENRLVNAVIVKEGMFVTTDFRYDRVRVWVNKHGIVTRVPAIG